MEDAIYVHDSDLRLWPEAAHHPYIRAVSCDYPVWQAGTQAPTHVIQVRVSSAR
jgi:hypothetical protein